jgi:hypothetical protein
MHFFADDTASGFVNDWAAGQVALIRVWDGVLSPAEVSTLAADPFGLAIPEPSCLALLLLCGMHLVRRHGRRNYLF